jgi:ribose transport system ATP-binding protein
MLTEDAAAGTAIILVSSDLDELAQVCDRVLAFSRGRIVAELARAEISVEALTRAVGGIAEAPQPPRGRVA